MAGEIQFSFKSLATCYALIRDRNGKIWSNSGTGGFDVYLSASYADYPVSCVEQGGSATYAGNFPSNAPPGTYGLLAKQQILSSPGETDPTVAMGNYEWNGSATFPLADLVTSGQISQMLPVRLQKGVAFSGFGFKLVSSLDHITPFTSGIVSGQISKNGGNFGPLQSGLCSEIGLGWYKVNLTSGDLNCDFAAMVFTANGISGGTSDQRDFGLICQKSSGSL